MRARAEGTPETRQTRRASVGRAGSAVGALVLMAVSVALPARAQSLAQRVASTRTEEITFAYASHPRLCGDGGGVIMLGHMTWVQSNTYVRGQGVMACERGPAHVVLRVRDGKVARLRSSVGAQVRGLDASATDLGAVSVREAADYLLDLAAHVSGSVGEDAITAAMFADSLAPWQRLAALARDRTIPRATRESASFWLATLASAKVAGARDWTEVEDEDARDEKDDERAQAVFALSQLEHDEGVPDLISVARTHRDPYIRRKAIFWLGQSGDERAVELFEEILR